MHSGKCGWVKILDTMDRSCAHECILIFISTFIACKNIYIFLDKLRDCTGSIQFQKHHHTYLWVVCGIAASLHWSEWGWAAIALWIGKALSFFLLCNPFKKAGHQSYCWLLELLVMCFWQLCFVFCKKSLVHQN